MERNPMPKTSKKNLEVSAFQYFFFVKLPIYVRISALAFSNLSLHLDHIHVCQ